VDSQRQQQSHARGDELLAADRVLQLEQELARANADRAELVAALTQARDEFCDERCDSRRKLHEPMCAEWTELIEGRR
jgi:hypothetical protein